MRCVIKPGVAKTTKNTRYPALSISNEWNPPEVDDGRTTTIGERREWLKEKRKESEREGRRLKVLIRLDCRSIQQVRLADATLTHVSMYERPRSGRPLIQVSMYLAAAQRFQMEE